MSKVVEAGDIVAFRVSGVAYEGKVTSLKTDYDDKKIEVCIQSGFITLTLKYGYRFFKSRPETYLDFEKGYSNPFRLITSKIRLK